MIRALVDSCRSHDDDDDDDAYRKTEHMDAPQRQLERNDVIVCFRRDLHTHQ